MPDCMPDQSCFSLLIGPWNTLTSQSTHHSLRRWRFAGSTDLVYAKGLPGNAAVLPEARAPDLGRVLSKRGYQVFVKQGSLYAFKGLAGKLGPLGVHASMLAIMAGAGLSVHAWNALMLARGCSNVFAVLLECIPYMCQHGAAWVTMLSSQHALASVHKYGNAQDTVQCPCSGRWRLLVTAQLRHDGRLPLIKSDVLHSRSQIL